MARQVLAAQVGLPLAQPATQNTRAAMVAELAATILTVAAVVELPGRTASVKTAASLAVAVVPPAVAAALVLVVVLLPMVPILSAIPAAMAA